MGVRLKAKTLRLKRLHQNPTRFPFRIPSKLKLSKLNLADNDPRIGHGRLTDLPWTLVRILN